jgi:hypothetical protein
MVSGVVQAVPREFLPDAEKPIVADFLLARKANLRGLFNGDRSQLPQWKGADL